MAPVDNSWHAMQQPSSSHQSGASAAELGEKKKAEAETPYPITYVGADKVLARCAVTLRRVQLGKTERS